LLSNGDGKIDVSNVTSTELGYLSGVTSDIQTQLGAKSSDTSVIKKDGSVGLTANWDVGSYTITANIFESKVTSKG